MKKVWREPTLDEILNDPTLDTLLARDGRQQGRAEPNH